VSPDRAGVEGADLGLNNAFDNQNPPQGGCRGGYLYVDIFGGGPVGAPF
jgi:hypothetical protein